MDAGDAEGGSGMSPVSYAHRSPTASREPDDAAQHEVSSESLRQSYAELIAPHPRMRCAACCTGPKTPCS
ncbi:hypothetical protein DIPPA_14737 [Diplonema papillatum]|nr:hypothetical protein DIPPA_14737 [Diplonema papillatum]